MPGRRYVTLLGPTRRRLVSLDRTNPKHAITLGNLATLGWSEYTGPAKADAAGFVVPGTDPDLAPPDPVVDDHAAPLGTGFEGAQ